MWRHLLLAVEIAILSALILATRCANYADVFVAGNVYFTDADCYARMTRVQMCAQHPGTIVRHHDFENFPQGTNPHTTAPLDYLILGLSLLLKAFIAHAIDLAGALISPLLALFTGWFLWWWSRKMAFRFRWAALLIFAISPILVHGTELGRPDHQSLSLALVIVAVCAEWTLRVQPSPGWSAVSGIAWGLAIWVSGYEPLVLLMLLLIAGLAWDRPSVFGKHRQIGWIAFGLTIAFGFAIEQRLPSLSILHSGAIFKNWSRTIGELAHAWPQDRVWLQWVGYLILLAPILILYGWRKSEGKGAGKTLPWFMLTLLIATYALTVWQVRWAYFSISIFAIVLPGLLEPFRSRVLVWLALILSVSPIARDWDQRIWPGEADSARRWQDRREAMELREMALMMMSPETRPFLAPWWLSPSIAYWSGQPGVAGSSHESLPGIAETARFFLAGDAETAFEILRAHKVSWVMAYDAERVTGNSVALLGGPGPERPLGRVLDRNPSQAPAFLTLSAQNSVNKLFQVGNNR